MSRSFCRPRSGSGASLAFFLSDAPSLPLALAATTTASPSPSATEKKVSTGIVRRPTPRSRSDLDSK